MEVKQQFITIPDDVFAYSGLVAPQSPAESEIDGMQVRSSPSFEQSPEEKMYEFAPISEPTYSPVLSNNPFSA
jgi:hypothetical protein